MLAQVLGPWETIEYGDIEALWSGSTEGERATLGHTQPPVSGQCTGRGDVPQGQNRVQNAAALNANSVYLAGLRVSE